MKDSNREFTGGQSSSCNVSANLHLAKDVQHVVSRDRPNPIEVETKTHQNISVGHPLMDHVG